MGNIKKICVTSSSGIEAYLKKFGAHPQKSHKKLDLSVLSRMIGVNGSTRISLSAPMEEKEVGWP